MAIPQTEISEDDLETESEDTKVARYLNSWLEGCSDPEFWQSLHHRDSSEESIDFGTIPEDEQQAAASSGDVVMTNAVDVERFQKRFEVPEPERESAIGEH